MAMGFLDPRPVSWFAPLRWLVQGAALIGRRPLPALALFLIQCLCMVGPSLVERSGGPALNGWAVVVIGLLCGGLLLGLYTQHAARADGFPAIADWGALVQRLVLVSLPMVAVVLALTVVMALTIDLPAALDAHTQVAHAAPEDATWVFIYRILVTSGGFIGLAVPLLCVWGITGRESLRLAHKALGLRFAPQVTAVGLWIGSLYLSEQLCLLTGTDWPWFIFETIALPLAGGWLYVGAREVFFGLRNNATQWSVAARPVPVPISIRH